MDFDSSWQGAALGEADKLATDDLAQLRHDRQGGYSLGTPEPYAAQGDMAIAARVDQRARAMGVGAELPP